MEFYKEFVFFRENAKRYEENEGMIKNFTYFFLKDVVENKKYQVLDLFLFRYSSLKEKLFDYFELMLFSIIVQDKNFSYEICNVLNKYTASPTIRNMLIHLMSKKK